ncbi:MAG: phosphatase PAP2 family protein [Halosimplex sp.]
MFRLVAASEAIREAVPAGLVPFFLAVTALGGSKFLMVGLSVTYWNAESRRRELVTLVGVAFVAVSATLALKYWFGLPRPPAGVRPTDLDPSPVGFPSGHAVAATTVYGGLLLAFDRYREPVWVGAAGAMIALVGLSRVALGVHFLGDVVAGIAVGLAMLGLLAVALDRPSGPTVVFATAVVCALPAAVLATETGDAALALGGSVGGTVAARWRTRADRFRSLPERAGVSVAGVAFVVAVIAVVETLEGVLAAAALFATAAVVYAVLVAGIVAVPSLVGRVDAFGTANAAE